MFKLICDTYKDDNTHLKVYLSNHYRLMISTYDNGRVDVAILKNINYSENYDLPKLYPDMYGGKVYDILIDIEQKTIGHNETQFFIEHCETAYDESKDIIHLLKKENIFIE